jgi:class 3 adenylate cyclase
VARLSSSAGTGEALVSDATWEAVGETPDELEHRELMLKGRSAPFGVRVVRAPAAMAADPT